MLLVLQDGLAYIFVFALESSNSSSFYGEFMLKKKHLSIHRYGSMKVSVTSTSTSHLIPAIPVIPTQGLNQCLLADVGHKQSLCCDFQVIRTRVEIFHVSLCDDKILYKLNPSVINNEKENHTNTNRCRLWSYY